MHTVFKALFLVFFVGLLAVVVQVARQLRGRPGGRVNQMAHELPILRVLRPVLGIVFYAALLDWLLPGTRLAWANSVLPSALRWAGGGASLAAILLLRRSFRAMGRNYRGGVGLWDDHELVATGPYHTIRHPIYAAFVLAMLGVWALSGNWLLGATGVALTLSIPAFRLPTEERQLRERFGPEYKEYAASTKRFVPGVF